MTRPIVIVALAMILSAMTGCGQDPQGRAVADPQAGGWVESPVIDKATRGAGGLRVSGRAAAGSRIVLRGDLGTAFAIGTGDDGRFDLLVPSPDADTLYVLEVQAGEDAVPAAERLLVSGDVAGPVALISPGSPTKRLDPGVGLDVVDSDGRTRIVSGRAAAGQRVVIQVDAAEPVTVTADAAGRWALNLGAIRAPSLSLIVDGVARVYPGEPGPEAPINRLMPSGRGTALRWQISDTALQSSWFADGGADVSARLPES